MTWILLLSFLLEAMLEVTPFFKKLIFIAPFMSIKSVSITFFTDPSIRKFSLPETQSFFSIESIFKYRQTNVIPFVNMF